MDETQEWLIGRLPGHSLIKNQVKRLHKITKHKAEFRESTWEAIHSTRTKSQFQNVYDNKQQVETQGGCKLSD